MVRNEFFDAVVQAILVGKKPREPWARPAVRMMGGYVYASA
jgi:hypothetical protein